MRSSPSLHRPRAVTPLAPPDFFEVLGAFEDWLEAADRSPSTRRGYLDNVARAGRIVRKDPRRFTKADVVAVLSTYQGQGPSKGSMLLAVRAFLRWAEEAGVLLDPGMRDPTHGLKVQVPRRGPAPSIGLPELRALLRSAFAHEHHRPPTHRRRGWAIMLAYQTAARVGSIAGIHPEDLRLDGDEPSVVFRTMKGGGEHEVPLGRMGVIAARHLLAYEGPKKHRSLIGVKEHMFRVWVEEAAKEGDVRYEDRLVWPHLLRHSAATAAYEATLDHIGVAEYLGHANLNHVRRYVGRSDPRKRRIAGAVGGSAPEAS